MQQRAQAPYRPTEAKYKGQAQEMYVTYDIEQKTRGGGTAVYPRVKRVYVAGDLKDWAVGDFTKRTGRSVHGVKIEYEQSRAGYQRRAFTAKRGETTYQVRPARIGSTKQHFAHVVEVPDQAQNVRFHSGELPKGYRQALQDVR